MAFSPAPQIIPKTETMIPDRFRSGVQLVQVAPIQPQFAEASRTNPAVASGAVIGII
jgi:hypothetical protein